MDILLHILYNTNAYEYILSWHHFIYNLSLKQLSSVRNRICQSLQSLSNRSNLTFNIEYIGFIEISDNRSIWSILSYHQFENRVVNIWSGFFLNFTFSTATRVIERIFIHTKYCTRTELHT